MFAFGSIGILPVEADYCDLDEDHMEATLALRNLFVVPAGKSKPTGS